MTEDNIPQDTSPEAARIYHELVMQRSGAERLRMGCEAFDAAKSIAASSMTGKPPPTVPGYGLAETLPERLFLRFYGREFTLVQQAEILKRIREVHGRGDAVTR